jgi:hypothetical protein
VASILITYTHAGRAYVLMAPAIGGSSGSERWSMAGTTTLVTSGSMGIGHGIVEELARFGTQVHTCARSAADLEECCRWWAEKGLRASPSRSATSPCVPTGRSLGQSQ